MSLTLEISARPPLADPRAVGRGLAAYNRAAHGRLRSTERWILAHDPAGAV